MSPLYPGEQPTELFSSPINDVQRVQVTQGTGYFGSIETSPWFQEATLPLEMVEQLQEAEQSQSGLLKPHNNALN